jgi:hypothetical protein
MGSVTLPAGLIVALAPSLPLLARPVGLPLMRLFLLTSGGLLRTLRLLLPLRSFGSALPGSALLRSSLLRPALPGSALLGSALLGSALLRSALLSLAALLRSGIGGSDGPEHEEQDSGAV